MGKWYSDATALRRMGWMTLFAALACGADPTDEPAEITWDAAPVERPVAVPTPTAPNQAPTIRRVALEPAFPRVGDRVTLEVEARDPDGDTLRTETDWTLEGGGAARHDRVYRVPAGAKGQSLASEVAVHDGRGGSTSAQIDVIVENTPPVVTAVELQPQSELTVERELAARAQGEDRDDDRLTFDYRWLVNGHYVPATGPVLTRQHFRRGDRITAAVTASDGESTSAPTRSAEIEVSNAPPRILTAGESITGEKSLRYRLRADDPDGDRQLRYRLVNAPAGVEVDRMSGELRWTPDDSQAGVHLVEIEVADVHGGRSTQTIELRVGSQPGPAAIP
jgi:hypothetical protein